MTKSLNHSKIVRFGKRSEQCGGKAMRLSTLGRYALRAMVDVALHDGQGPVQRKMIAERQEISGHYLAQLLAKLRRAGLVQSMLGPGGGYVLARPASEISAGDVLRAVEEPLSPVYCVDSDQVGVCQREGGCPTRTLWARLGEAVSGVLDATTLAALCAARDSLVEERSSTERKGTNA